ncbi:MAG: CCA tRNA nucleotidyltransferase [Actinomycetota bacterium]|nr:CCA tRNA nucleotidyltransferase [Actinomycetota bacterium]
MLPEAVTPAIDAVAPVTRRFAAAGHRLYLVGGIVRDLLAGRPVRRQDLDLTTDAEPTVVKELVTPVASSLWTQGERFGTIGCIVEGQDLEITTHRADRYDGATRKPTVEFSDDVVADLSRRDFTINAIAIEVTTGSPRLIDPFDGAGDLAAGVLRTPIDPVVSFSDDPLRMLRAARFIAGFGLEPVEELTAAVTDMGARMSIVSRERVRDELVKLLSLGDPTAGLEFLRDTGLLRVVLPDVAATALLDDRGGCHPDALAHTVTLVASTEDRTARLAALLADPASLAPGVTRDDDGLGRRLRSLRFSNDTTSSVLTAVRSQRALDLALDERSDPSLRRLVASAGSDVTTAIELVRAEAVARRAVDSGAVDSGAVDGRAVDGGALRDRVGDLSERLAELSRTEDLQELGPTVDGAAVMARLAIRPGPEVGAALAYLSERRIESGPRDAADELDDVASWWSQRERSTADRSGPDVP